jgi:hypothetical protein
MQTILQFGQLVVTIELYLVVFAPVLVIAWGIHVAKSLRRLAKAQERKSAVAISAWHPQALDAIAESQQLRKGIFLSALGR